MQVWCFNNLTTATRIPDADCTGGPGLTGQHDNGRCTGPYAVPQTGYVPMGGNERYAVYALNALSPPSPPPPPPSPLQLSVISTATPLNLSLVSHLSLSNVIGLRFSPAANLFFGIGWSAALSQEHFLSADPATGLVRDLGVIPGVSLIESGSNHLVGSSYYFVAAQPSRIVHVLLPDEPRTHPPPSLPSVPPAPLPPPPYPPFTALGTAHPQSHTDVPGAGCMNPSPVPASNAAAAEACYSYCRSSATDPVQCRYMWVYNLVHTVGGREPGRCCPKMSFSGPLDGMSGQGTFYAMLSPSPSPPPPSPPQPPPPPNAWPGALADGDFTLTADVYCDTPADGTYKPVMSHQTNAAAPSNLYAGFDLQIQANGDINFFMGNGVGYGVSFDAGKLTASTWTSLMVQVIGTSASVSVNGVVTGQGTFTGTRQTSHVEQIRVGRYTNSLVQDQIFVGEIRNPQFTAHVPPSQPPASLPPPSPPPPSSTRTEWRVLAGLTTPITSNLGWTGTDCRPTLQGALTPEPYIASSSCWNGQWVDRNGCTDALTNLPSATTILFWADILMCSCWSSRGASWTFSYADWSYSINVE